MFTYGRQRKGWGCKRMNKREEGKGKDWTQNIRSIFSPRPPQINQPGQVFSRSSALFDCGFVDDDCSFGERKRERKGARKGARKKLVSSLLALSSKHQKKKRLTKPISFFTRSVSSNRSRTNGRNGASLEEREPVLTKDEVYRAFDVAITVILSTLFG